MKLLKILVIILIVTSSVHSSDWTTYQHDAQHTGVNNDISFTFPLELRWEKDISSGPIRPVTVVGDKAVITSYWPYYHTCKCGFILCIDANTGDSLWMHKFDTLGTFISQATFGHGNVYFQKSKDDSSAFIGSYNLLTGEKNWHGTYSSQGTRPLAPTIYDSLLFFYAGTFDDLFCINANLGNQIWYKSIQLNYSSPTVYNDRVYAVKAGHLGIYSLITGDLLHDIFVRDSIKNTSTFSKSLVTQITGQAFCAPVIDTINNLVFTNSQLEVTAYDILNQKVLWGRPGYYLKYVQIPPEHLIVSSPPFYNNELFVTDSTCLVSLNATTGEEIWEFCGDDSGIVYNPVIGDGYLFLSSSTQIYVIEIESKETVWTYPVSGHLSLANNGLYVANHTGKVYFFGSVSTDIVENEFKLPEGYTLSQNYPNPFNPSTTIEFSLPQNSFVKIEILNIAGQKVRMLLNQEYSAGSHTVSWNGKDDNGNQLSSGIYLYRLVTDNITLMKKMVLLK